MTSPSPSAEHFPQRRRPTVHIVGARSASRTAMVSMLIVACATALAFAVYRFWSSDGETPPPLQRTLGDVILDWKCESGHAFRQAGQLEPTVCPLCAAQAYPVDTYLCDVHGSVTVMVGLALSANGEPQVVQFRLPGRDWTDLENGIRCPRCDHELTRKPPDPLEGAFKRKKKENR